VYDQNVSKTLHLLQPTDVVLDIGGLRSLREDQRSSWMFWEGTFTWSETNLVGPDATASELDGYLARVHPYPEWQLRADRIALQAPHALRRALRKIPGARRLVHRLGNRDLFRMSRRQRS
jgi:hypothetical protein